MISAARRSILAAMGIGTPRAWLRLISVQHVAETPGAPRAAVRYAIEPTGTFVAEFTEPLGQLALRSTT
jgi:hypothetical protein